MKRMNFRKSVFLPTVVFFLFAAMLSAVSLAYAQQSPPKLWSEKELKAFLDRPYTAEEKAKMGDVEIEKTRSSPCVWEEPFQGPALQ